MSAISAPYGVRPVAHPSGEVRFDEVAGGIASGYNTALYTNTPVKRAADGTFVACAAGVDVIAGVFCGCRYIKGGRPIVSAYWPANETYDTGSMVAWIQPLADGNAIFEAQADGPVAVAARGEYMNLKDASQGSVNVQLSTQRVDSVTTGATLGMFQVIGLAPYPDNDWGDAFTQVRLRPTNIQGGI